MKKNIITLTAALIMAVTTYAQPGPVKNAGKSVFTLTTFKEDGSILASSHGIFISNDGEAVSDWTPFEGAASAIVIDATGKKMDVTSMIDGNDLYDMAKFRVTGKTVAANLATTASPSGSEIYLVGYAVKKPSILTGKVTKSETFMDKYNYYVVDMEIPENVVCCPLVNGAGQVIGLLQTTRSGELHSTDVRFAQDFSVNSLSANSPLLRKCGIPIELPDKEEEAQLALLLIAQSNNEAKYVQTVENFIRKFPQSHEGYVTRAQYALGKGEFDSARSDMEKAISIADNKAEAHYRYSNLIYQKEIYQSDKPYEAWSIEKALEEARTAYSIDPQPVYRHLEAQILYSQKEYQAAQDIFQSLTKTEIKNPELFFEIAQCKTQLNADKAEVVEMLDSAVATYGKPLTSAAAPYVLARALANEEIGKYRKAVTDYNLYDTLMLGRNNAAFYFQREQCEVKAKMFQQALNDIEVCIYLEPQDPDYFLEKAQLLLRLGKNDEAIETAERCLLIDDKFSNAYLIMGVAQIQSGNKKAGLATLGKAKEMGNEQAQVLIDKYK